MPNVHDVVTFYDAVASSKLKRRCGVVLELNTSPSGIPFALVQEIVPHASKQKVSWIVTTREIAHLKTIDNIKDLVSLADLNEKELCSGKSSSTMGVANASCTGFMRPNVVF